MEISALGLGGNGSFIHWGVVQLSAANLVVICLMLLFFALAVLVPFGRPPRGPGGKRG